jgi:hypothetical protein
VRVSREQYPNAKGEIALRDLLAYFVYGIYKRNAFRAAFKTDKGRKFYLRDGDPRNLLPSNVAISEDTESEEMIEKKLYAPRAKKNSRVTTLTHDTQLDLLAEAALQKSLMRIAVSKLRSEKLAEEVLGAVVLSIVEQIRANKYCGVDASVREQENHFRQWVMSSAFRQCEKRAQANIRLGDVESDRVAIRLRRVLQYEKEIGVPSPDRHSMALQLEKSAY